jgi:manganese/zinc/iron transport system permease protein
MEWTFIDTWIVFVGALSAGACALLGNYLLLRRMSMMGDAISHAVLPGLAIAFLITGSRDSLPMLMGAILVGVITTLMIQGIDRLSGLDRGASMGVVFTTLFAIGLILIRQAADHVDLDPSCVLYGAIELTPLDTVALLGWEIPQAAITSGFMLVLNLLFVLVFFKELKITSFDPALATTMGFNADAIHYVLMTLVAATTIAAFESVGSILVIAMLIVPGATAHLMTDRLGAMLFISIVFAVLSAFLGHLGAITIPTWFGFRDTSTAGMMAVATGFLFLLAFFFSPRYGVFSRIASQFRLGLRIVGDDILGFLYRYQELAPAEAEPIPATEIKNALRSDLAVNMMIWRLKAKGFVQQKNGGYALTSSGLNAGKGLIRSHRLWESYLCNVMGYCDADVHQHAHQFEHFTDPKLQEALVQVTGNPDQDPHHREIPK